MDRRAEEIRDLCQSWVDAATPGEGTIAIGGETERYRLLPNGVRFHDLNHEQVRAACLGLSSVLLLPGMNTIIDWDHQWFWSWCGELLCGVEGSYFKEDERELQELMGLCCRASLAGIWRPDSEGWEKMQVQSRSLEPNAKEWVQRSHHALAYLAFPLLEGLLKKSCSEFVSPDGTVLRPFRGKDGREQYGSPGEKGRSRCNSLRDLLELFHRDVAPDEARLDLDEQKNHLAAFAAQGEDGFDVLYRWRNSSLHGQASFPTIAGTVLNTAFLVSLSGLSAEYEQMRANAVERVRWEQMSSGGTNSRSPWAYYPPYI